MKKLDLDSVQEVTEFKRVTTGGYICKITAVDDIANKEYLYLEYDIVEGEFKGYYADLYKNKGFWGGRFNRSYKESALGFFKAFVSSVEKSNAGYKWDSDEQKLKGKLVGIVLAEEEYRKNDGSIGTRLYVSATKSVEDIRKGNYRVPDKKKLAVSATPFYDASTEDDDELPFN